jgi:hypothetical protein
MSSWPRRRLLVWLPALLLVALTPRPSYAILHWFRDLFSGSSYYNIPVSNYHPPVNACGPMTATYVPTTFYRAVPVQVAQTTLRPVSGVDPCTGCQVTTMRPVTTTVCQQRMVPYSSYRIVYSNPCATPAASTTYYANTAASYSVVAPGCCGAGGTSTSSAFAPAGPYPATLTAPALSTVGVAPIYSSSASLAPTLGSSFPAATTIAPDESAAPPPTFAPENAAPNATESPQPVDALKPKPGTPADSTPPTTSEEPAPELGDPHSRTTRYSIQRVVPSVHNVSRTTGHARPTPAASSAPAATTVDGWRASTR